MSFSSTKTRHHMHRGEIDKEVIAKYKAASQESLERISARNRPRTVNQQKPVQPDPNINKKFSVPSYNLPRFPEAKSTHFEPFESDDSWS